MIWKKSMLLVALVASVWACSDDDDLNVEVLPPRLLSEVEVENDDDIQEYLRTHFYNYEEFQNPPADFDFKIVFDTIAGDNSGKTPLMNQVEQAQVVVTSDEFGLSEEETVTHTYYYLVARDGEGESPSVADSVFVRYRGTLLDGTDFDGSFEIPVWFDLGAIQGPQQGARGFSVAIPNFETGGSVIDNGDGTFFVNDYGIGAMFLPSGLGFFNAAQGEIPSYSPLIFTIDLWIYEEADHDGDGIPSILEDLNGDGYLYNDNTDEQQEENSNSIVRFSDFLDTDDDQDGTPTREEIIIDDQGNITFPDTDNDGIPDYRDRDNP